MSRMAAGSETIKNYAAFIWSVADLLRGDYKQSEYGKVALPLTVLRRFDCVLAPVKQEMLDAYDKLKGKVENFGPVLDQLTAVDGLWNTSKFDIPKLLDRLGKAAASLVDWEFFTIDGKDICRVSIVPSDHPVYEKRADEKLFWGAPQ